jgi:hypothetical protein
VRAGRDRYTSGQQLFLRDGGQVHPVVVIKLTGQTPVPELLCLEFVDGRREYRLPFDLWPVREPAEMVAAAQSAYAEAVRRFGRDSSEAQAERDQLRQAIVTADRANPYLRR